jgi:hypothetical protein
MIDDSIWHGAVSIPHGHHEANVNRLTNKDDIDVATGMVRYSGIAVSLHPARCIIRTPPAPRRAAFTLPDTCGTRTQVTDRGAT